MKMVIANSLPVDSGFAEMMKSAFKLVNKETVCQQNFDWELLDLEIDGETREGDVFYYAKAPEPK